MEIHLSRYIFQMCLDVVILIDINILKQKEAEFIKWLMLRE